MNKSILLLLMVSIWPFNVVAMEPGLIKHLLLRSSFGVAESDLAAFSDKGYEQAVRQLLDSANYRATQSPPAELKLPRPSRKAIRAMNFEQKKDFRKQRNEKMWAVKAWWLTEMITTDSPLTENMTLFWHNHFTSSYRKVKVPELLYRQNVTLRQHALGNFREMLFAIAKDPAMLIYLDGIQNKRQAPNENFARELLELFTLGEGHYSEQDIKQAAIAFSGWNVNRNTGEFVFRKKWHDPKPVVFIGQNFSQKGTAKGEALLEWLLKQPQTAVYLSQKLVNHFVGNADQYPELIEELANQLRKNDYDIKPWLQRLFLSEAFRQQQATGNLIKSPVDLVVGTIRSLDLDIENKRQVVKALRRLGQDLMDPPNVKGWAGGTDWITTDTLKARQNILLRVVREQKKQQGNMNRMLNQQELPLMALDYQIETANGKPESLQSLLLNPAYQVK